jgi:parallel beta-helix repeat protein
MSRKPFYSLLFLVVLMGVSTASFNVHNVEAPYPIVYIKAEGAIDPPTANITSPDNVTYTFTADINASIVVQKDNIVVDGAGYTVQGGGDGTGIDLSSRSNVTIKNMKIRTFGTGIYLYESSNNMISGNVITDNGLLGVYLYLSSNNNTVSANTITNNYRGIWLEVSTGTSSNNVISRNNIENNIDGIMIYRSLGNIISENNVTKNTDHGIYFDTSYDNRIYHNNFIYNGIPWGFYLCTNTWDAGYPLGGNYWSDYNGTDLFSGLYQNETGSDGIGDTTYIMPFDNKDNYPLMGMFLSFNTSPGYPVDVVCNSSIEDFEYFDSTIRLHVSNSTANQTHGFCRLTILHDLLPPSYDVTINSIPVNHTLLFENDTLTLIHLNYTHSTVEIVITPEFPSFLILPLFMTATLLAVIVFRRQQSMDACA